ncbi:LysE family translocator [Limnohabitans sp. B9-3]|uniref:LysE family translocator n=1 Tax=Limnohabitans sp. B9-3 TaxID=1100707 RepID=UPI000C1F46BC|nr:LysE family translocator [Limnohabitans sp. B9-3]PIT77663.1 lysine transporter LysE [Limnohabitans sp. B9-3]
MQAAELSALLMLLTATSFTPGPNTTLSTALAANRGLRHALPFVVSVPVGWGLILSLSAAGVGALIEAQPALRSGIQVVGVAYLLWLAFKLARAAAPSSAQVERLDVTFLQGVMLQFVNIKAWMLALTLVSGWLAGRPDFWPRLGLLLPAMVAFGFASNLTYALIGSLLRAWLNGPKDTGLRRRWFNRGMAAILVLTATWMAKF